METRMKELTLLLLYLSGWEEDSRNHSGEKVFRSWKGYKFEVLDELESEKLISQQNGKQPVIFTKAGMAEAERLKKLFLP